jgi:hypothetical protein
MITIQLTPGCSRDDRTADVLSALAALGTGPGRLDFAAGDYHFWGSSGRRCFLSPCNNANGVQNVIFLLDNCKDLEIDGGGARFIFHGEAVPFWIKNSSSVSLRNFTIDWQRPFYSQGRILRVDEDGLDFEVDTTAFPCEIENGRLLFTGEDWRMPLIQGVMELDGETGAPAFLSGDNFGATVQPDKFLFSKVTKGVFRLNYPFPRLARVGNWLLLRHYPRLSPAIFLHGGKDYLLENIAIHHAGAMGIIGQYCENVSMERLRVLPTPGSGRVFSVAVDASHFVNCRGIISQKDCHFSHQMDDPCNVHGTYGIFRAGIDRKSAYFATGHMDQRGFPLAMPGDVLGFYDLRNYALLGEARVDKLAMAADDVQKIVFKGAIPDVGCGHEVVVENHSAAAGLLVTGCRTGPNRARGYLVSTRGKVIFENNDIEAAGAGIKISGDGKYWYESGPVEDVTIRGNRFGDCCYGPPEWGRAVIDIDPEIDDPWTLARSYHRNITISGNVFKTYDSGIVFARSVEGLAILDNRIKRSGTYPHQGRLPALFNAEACRKVSVENNSVDEAITEPILELHDYPPGFPRIELQPSLEPPVAAESVLCDA